jgi:hypothetical protein
LDEVAGRQAGVFSRAQARACGLTDEMIAANVAAGRWRRVVRGVYSQTTGSLSRLAVLWVALLRLGAGAILSHETAAELWGLARPSTPIHVTVPTDRPRRALPGVLLHRSCRVEEARHPARMPPRTTVEETVVDLTQTAPDLDTAAARMASAVGARLTTPLRIAEALGRRPRVRWRLFLACILRDIAIGCHSLLELLYLRNVERAHGLPPSRRQVRTSSDGRVQYRDAEYREYATVIELDGKVAHPERFRDMRRDNAVVENSGAPLRYGYEDVVRQPCQVARQVAKVLTSRGWRGRPRRCNRPGCVIA